ncbi:sulfatase family protein [Marinigracilibium pacificum]|uniref:Sulfatase n=1 Tax=Marinigracilibium pacificum TaxID=2729599 RepID=A0A848J319_9BACT|nr:sulfatase [Marinigracilibium pacificum]NMM47572.1 sulfatase [Marinigracilibium pacificum]
MNILRYHIIICLLVAFLAACNFENEDRVENKIETKYPSFDFQPNIIWIVAEDMSGNIPAFGDSTIKTPTLSSLASEGICYDNFFTPSPVCAPARSAIITGMYPTAIGTHNMRTGPWWVGIPNEAQLKRYNQFVPEGIGAYEAVPPPEVKLFTEYLRKAGYYTTNNAKEDYQFLKTPTAWDECSDNAHWRNRKPGQPFFSVFNLFVTHESQIWEKSEDSLWVDPNLKVPVPPYLPDTNTGRKDIRRMYSNILEMDHQVSEILQQLEDDGLLDSTIVMWYTDHGGPLPRQKRSLHDSGIKVPLIVRFPNNFNSGNRDDRMISFVDLAPTVLSLAGIKPPEYMQGHAFLGTYIQADSSPYIFAATDRFDKNYDQSRAVRDKRFKYIRNYITNKSTYLPISYRENMAIMQELIRLKDKDSLTEVQKLWFKNPKSQELLYDLQNDPHEINDLSDNPQYADKLKSLREANEFFIKEINDKGFIDEKVLLEQFEPGGKQLKTNTPVPEYNDGTIKLTCDTDGASLGFRKITPGVRSSFFPYKENLVVNSGERYQVIAHRLGYLPSDTVTIRIIDDSIETNVKFKSDF